MSDCLSESRQNYHLILVLKHYICLLVVDSKQQVMTPLEISQLRDLGNAVAGLIKIELGAHGSVHTVANQIIVSISRFEVEHRLGNLLQQIYRTVDQHFPVRKQHLSLIIRDSEGVYENCFKIWKSAY